MGDPGIWCMDLLGDFCHLTDLNPDFILSLLPVTDTDTL